MCRVGWRSLARVGKWSAAMSYPCIGKAGRRRVDWADRYTKGMAHMHNLHKVQNVGTSADVPVGLRKKLEKQPDAAWAKPQSAQSAARSEREEGRPI